MNITPSVAPRLWFHALDADSIPVTDLVPAGITSAAYVTITAGVRSAASSISLGAKVADTTSHATGQLVTIRASDGWYAIDAPAGAALAAADYAELVIVLTDGTRLVYPTLHPITSGLEGDVEVTNVSEISAAVIAGLTGIRLSFQQQAAFADAKTLQVYQGDDYTDDPATITIDQSGMTDPMADLSSYKLVVSFVQGSGVKGFRMPIIGTPGSHTALFDPPSTETETLETGRHNALFRIEYGPNKYKVVNPGFVQVDAHDIDPGDIIDI